MLRPLRRCVPPGAIARLGTVRLRPAQGLKQFGKGRRFDLVGFLDGDRLVATRERDSSAETDGSIVLWDAATGKEVRQAGAGAVFRLLPRRQDAGGRG